MRPRGFSVAVAAEECCRRWAGSCVELSLVTLSLACDSETEGDVWTTVRTLALSPQAGHAGRTDQLRALLLLAPSRRLACLSFGRRTGRSRFGRRGSEEMYQAMQERGTAWLLERGARADDITAYTCAKSTGLWVPAGFRGPLTARLPDWSMEPVISLYQRAVTVAREDPTVQEAVLRALQSGDAAAVSRRRRVEDQVLARARRQLAGLLGNPRLRGL